jgi:hypothetical protein
MARVGPQRHRKKKKKKKKKIGTELYGVTSPNIVVFLHKTPFIYFHVFHKRLLKLRSSACSDTMELQITVNMNSNAESLQQSYPYALRASQ